MYSKHEAAQLKKDFWTVFGGYMRPVPSAEGDKISWVNYKTGEKNIFFRMHVDDKIAIVAIELTHKEAGVQELYFQQFLQLKPLLIKSAGKSWTWQLLTNNDSGQIVSRIETTLQPISVFKKEDWPQLISFFKKNMIALDDFWSKAKYSFELLR